MSDLGEAILAAIDADEQVVRAAIDPVRPGTHWQWVTAKTDVAVAPGDLVLAQEDQRISLRTVEEFPLQFVGGMCPTFILGYVEEVESGPGDFIAHFDPATVLATLAAHRSIVKRCEGTLRVASMLASAGDEHALTSAAHLADWVLADMARLYGVPHEPVPPRLVV